MPGPLVRRAAIASVCGIALLASSQTPAGALRAPGTPPQAWVTPRVSAWVTIHPLAAARTLVWAYSPSQIEAAYEFAPLYARDIDGTGQTVALIETEGLRRQDVHKFDRAYHLVDPRLHESYIGGRHFQTQAGGETVLDVEWLHALAPGATIQIYYLKNDRLTNNGVSPASWMSMATALRTAAANGADIISISLGACGPSQGFNATSSAFSSLTQRGVSIFVASGDSGDHPGSIRDCGDRIGVAYPSSDPSVVSVGGTSLSLNADSTIEGEVGWSLSGGGLVKKFVRPAWQVAPQLPGDKHRWAPDVSFLGDPDTGVNAYYKNSWRQAGGTSLGAPGWAAAWALVRENAQQAGQQVGAAPALLYRIANSSAYTHAFHDVTFGSNGRYSAGPGWDAVTGWGTPDVAGLAAAVLSVPNTH
jgi:kumamolisin